MTVTHCKDPSPNRQYSGMTETISHTAHLQCLHSTRIPCPNLTTDWVVRLADKILPEFAQITDEQKNKWCNEIESRSSQTIRIRSYEPSKHDGVSRCVCVSELVMLKNWKSKPYLWSIHRYVNVRKIKCVSCKSNTQLINGTCISWM